MAYNMTTAVTPSGPSCSVYPQPPLVSFISDKHLSIILPTIVYIISSAFFHFLDTYGIFSSYRIHPSEDVLRRNHVTRGECLKQVVGYHVMQIAIGLLLTWGEGPAMIGDEACSIHSWAEKISRSRSGLPPLLLKILGIDASGLAGIMKKPIEGLARGLSGGDADLVYQTLRKASGVTPFDVLLAKATFYVGIPFLQFFVALAIVDTWIYFTHRLCHINKTLYRYVHARHHLLYVSYAYGAVYGHPFESLFLDILSFVIASYFAQFSHRQAMVFGSFAVIKTISDHCGYVFPYDPFLAVNANGARFHDLHHQTWGLKNNFSTYTTFWDRVCGTIWSDEAAEKKRAARSGEAERK